MRNLSFACLVITLVSLAGCGGRKATPEEARKFIDDAEQKLLALGVDAGRADWIKATYITDDTEAVSAKIDERAIAATVDYAKQATRFDGLQLDPVTARKIKLLKLSLTIATPSDPKESEELTRIVAGMEGTYGKGKYCPGGPESCKDLEDLSKILAESRDPKQAAGRLDRLARHRAAHAQGFRALRGAGQQGRPRARLQGQRRHVALQVRHAARRFRQGTGPALGAGAAALPFAARLRPRPAAREVRRRGSRQRPHSGPPAGQYVGAGMGQHLPAGGARQRRPRLRSHRPAQEAQHRLEADGEVRRELLHLAGIRAAAADLLGALAVPASRATATWCATPAPGISTTWTICASRCASRSPARTSSPSITSWATTSTSAPTTKQPPSFRDSANDGFHEAIGDTIALSITPEYLVKIGLLDKAPGHLQGHRPAAAQGPGEDRLPALRPGDRPVALEGLLRRDPAREVQRDVVAAAPEVPGHRAASPAAAETDFDPGAKYHVAANVPYMRYFLADILQFQFHRALAQAAGCTGPLNRCSIYGNKEAGARLNAMLEMGAEPPLAGSPGEDRRHARDGRHRHPRLLRPVAEMAGRAEPGETGRVVGEPAGRNTDAKSAIDEMVHRIAERCSPERIILFGSHALGQLVKLCAGWKPALRAGFQPAAGCHPAPRSKTWPNCGNPYSDDPAATFCHIDNQILST